jgi:hypothetical protein
MEALTKKKETKVRESQRHIDCSDKCLEVSKEISDMLIKSDLPFPTGASILIGIIALAIKTNNGSEEDFMVLIEEAADFFISQWGEDWEAF